MNIADVQTLFKYNGWANHQLIGAAASLGPEELARDLGSSLPSIRETLLHIMWTEWVWVQRWNGRSPKKQDVPKDELSDARAIGLRWRSNSTDLRAFLDALTENDLARRVRYENFAGETHEYALVRTLQHVVNHSTYHRGQIVTMFRQLGHKPPSTDLLVYLDEVDASTAAVPSTGADRPAR